MILLKLVAPAAAAAAMLTGGILRDNLTDLDIPFKVFSAGVVAEARDGRVSLVYSASFKVNDTVDLIMHRTVTCGSITVELPDVSKRYEPGSGRINLLSLADPIPTGSLCHMEVALNWLPTFSLYDHVEKLPPIVFSTPVIGKDK